MPHRYPRRRLVRGVSTHRIATYFALFLSLPLPSLWAVIPLKAQAASSIRIEEITWTGSSRSTADEWIELANLGDATSTIGGWILKGAGTSDREIVIPEGAEIPPQGTYLISNYAETDEKTALAIPTQFTTTTISLSNAEMNMQLFDSNALLIDQAGNGSAPFAGSVSPFASMLRTNALIQGDQKEAWTSSTSSIGFKEGSTETGTPGLCDLCVDTKVDSHESIIVDETTTTSTTLTTDTNTDTDTTTTSTQSSSSNATTQPRNDATIFLNEIVSNPSSGKEWIELRFEDGTTSTDRQLLIYDGQGKITTIATGTVLAAPPYLLIQLPSAKLNNGGDSLSIREADGTIIEQTNIPALEKGQSWIRNAEGDGWEITDTITPTSENVSYRTPKPQTTTVTKIVTSATESPSAKNTTLNQTSSYATTQPRNYATFSLNEIISNPSSGPEWIELYTPSDATSTDRTLKLRDSKSVIKTIPTSTPLTLPHYLVIPLSGSKLTNSGEVLSLTDASGTTMEATTIPKLGKGESWIKKSDGAWAITTMLTPASENKQSEDETPSLSTTSTSIASNQSQETESISDDALDDVFTAAEESNAKTSQTVKTSLASKKSDSLTSPSFMELFDDTANGTRVRVSGSVASIPKLFGASHVFILQNEDGRGAVVYVPAQEHLPAFGSSVRVDATISATDYGPQLRMKKTDAWTTIATSTPPQPRVVDLLAPSAEDAWSLVSVQGKVVTVGTSSFTIETDDAITLTISSPTVVGFRTKRLLKGDTVRITGLFDIKKTSPTILIRVPEDVALVSHAPESITPPETASKETDKRFPNWVPFASAGVAIIATGGVKRLREGLRKRKLKKMANHDS